MKDFEQLALEEGLSRAFKGLWIPKEIWLNEELSLAEKVLLSEISGGVCSASNEELGKFLGLSSKTIANLLTILRKNGYIKTVSFDGRKRALSLTEKAG